MRTLGTVTKDRDSDPNYNPADAVQTVRIDGAIRKVPVGDGNYRIGSNDDPDFAAGVTDDDLADELSGVGRELSKAGIGSSAPFHNEVGLAARSGSNRQVRRDGHTVHIAQAIDEIEDRHRTQLMDGWEADTDFIDLVADLVADEFGFAYADVVQVIKNRG